VLFLTKGPFLIRFHASENEVQAYEDFRDNHVLRRLTLNTGAASVIAPSQKL
jgi:hypothetical protein